MKKKILVVPETIVSFFTYKKIDDISYANIFVGFKSSNFIKFVNEIDSQITIIWFE